MQLGFGEGWISQKIDQNAALERLAKEVDWRPFEALLGITETQGPGRPPKERLLMLKALLLQQRYGLSDADLEDALNDRMSFIHAARAQTRLNVMKHGQSCPSSGQSMRTKTSPCTRTKTR